MSSRSYFQLVRHFTKEGNQAKVKSEGKKSDVVLKDCVSVYLH